MVKKIELQYSVSDNIKTETKILYFTENNGKTWEPYDFIKIEYLYNNEGNLIKEIHYDSNDEVNFLFNYYYSN